MARLLLFNPENDLALAANNPNYTPPAAACAMRATGALLPMWWARPGDLILAPQSMAHRLEQLKNRFNLNGELATPDNITTVTELLPWGWSPAVVTTFKRADVDPTLLPSAESILTIRNLSHRHITIELHKALGSPASMVPREAFNIEEANDIIDHMGGDFVVKIPWSGSGRGVLFSSATDRDTIMRQIEGSIRHQGSVIIEPEFRRAYDFASLFYSDGERVEFRGYSVFTVDPRGMYIGNYVVNQHRMAEMIGCDLSVLTPKVKILEAELTRLVAPGYSGWIGVDMMLYRPQGSTSLEVNPCIEVNLRMTMGVVALCLAHRAMSPHHRGLLRMGRCQAPHGSIDLTADHSSGMSIWLEIHQD